METVSSILPWVSTVALAVALAASAGLRAWLPLLITSALARADVVRLGESFEFLATTPALVLFSIATLVEIVADKVPVVDHALDSVSTIVRPASGALLAAAVMWRAEDPLLAAVLGIVVGAPVALAPHVVKSGTRAASTAATAGTANPLLSLAEDVASAALAIVAFVVPVLALVALVALAVAVWRRLRRSKAPPPAAPRPVD